MYIWSPSLCGLTTILSIVFILFSSSHIIMLMGSLHFKGGLTRLRSTPTHKWIPLLCNCFYICVVCRHTSLLDLKQRRNGVFHFRSTNSFSGGTRGVKRLIFLHHAGQAYPREIYNPFFRNLFYFSIYSNFCVSFSLRNLFFKKPL